MNAIRSVFMTADTVGGVWNYSLELARGLTEQGVHVTLATLGGRLNPQQRAAAGAVPGLTVYDSDYRLEWMQNPWTDLDAAGPWLLERAQAARPDVVHLNHYAHGHLPWPAPVLTVAHSCVYSWHHRVRGTAPGSEWRRYRRLVRRGLQASDAVVAPTAAMLADAGRHYGPLPQPLVIHNGRRPMDWPQGRKEPAVLTVGRLWDEAKGLSALSAAAPRLDWPVWVAGEERHPDGGRAPLAGVEPLGRLAPRALADRYARAAVYALPARYEPFGLSALEAALAGCALVLGDIPSLRELWEEAALFVPPGDADALAAAINRLSRRPNLRRDLARRAHQRALSYDSRRMTAQYLQLYAALQVPQWRAEGA